MPKWSDPNPVDVFIGNAVRDRRRRLGVSQEKLGEALSLTFQQVQKYENGANRISGSKLHTIAAALACEPGDFFPPVGVNEEAAPIVDPATKILAADGGLELALIYPRLAPRHQRAVLALAQSLSV